jgi:hypothetical protein
MRGIPLFNFPAFDRAAKDLRGRGHEVWSPAENDVEKDGFDPATDQPRGMPHYMARDLPAVCMADAVAVLPGWEKSRGATLEVHVARALDKPVLDAQTLEPVTDEVRVTDPVTGGQKGSKLERFDLIPVEPLEELARVYGRGAAKYADHNWRRGYKWGLSFAAMMRHAWRWWRGEDRDELGNHHLGCVAWHAFALMWFSQHHQAGDDRAL